MRPPLVSAHAGAALGLPEVPQREVGQEREEMSERLDEITTGAFMDLTAELAASGPCPHAGEVERLRREFALESARTNDVGSSVRLFAMANPRVAEGRGK